MSRERDPVGIVYMDLELMRMVKTKKVSCYCMVAMEAVRMDITTELDY